MMLFDCAIDNCLFAKAIMRSRTYAALLMGMACAGMLALKRKIVKN